MKCFINNLLKAVYHKVINKYCDLFLNTIIYSADVFNLYNYLNVLRTMLLFVNSKMTEL